MRTCRFRAWTMALLLLAAVAGCASTGGTRMNLNRLTEAEIQSVDVATMYDVIQRLRPRWLDVRAATSFGGSTDVVVFQGQSHLGGVEVLRQLSPDAARWLEYLDGAQASASLPGMGSRRVEGAIVIHTSPPRD